LSIGVRIRAAAIRRAHAVDRVETTAVSTRHRLPRDFILAVGAVRNATIYCFALDSICRKAAQ
jgi:hypothetical protein